jgi:hypothetical protein
MYGVDTLGHFFSDRMHSGVIDRQQERLIRCWFVIRDGRSRSAVDDCGVLSAWQQHGRQAVGNVDGGVYVPVVGFFWAIMAKNNGTTRTPTNQKSPTPTCAIS